MSTNAAPANMMRQKSRSIADIARGARTAVCPNAPIRRPTKTSCVADNFASLKAAGLVEAGVPAELGGGGAGVDELSPRCCASSRIIAARRAGVFPCTNHQVAGPAWRWRVQKAAAVEPLLQAHRRPPNASSCCPSAAPTGSAAPASREGRTAVIASPRERCFRPARPPAIFLMTGAGAGNRKGEPPTVLHFGVPMSSPAVKVLDKLAHARHARHRLERCRDRRPCGAEAAVAARR